MKLKRTIPMLLLMLLGAAGSSSALAQWHGGHGGGHIRFGINFGFPLYGPGYYVPPPYYYPPYYYPPAAPYYYPPVAPQEPQSYIEQGSSQASPAAPRSESFWYYCAESKSYYPYVKECPGGWQAVSPQPPPG